MEPLLVTPELAAAIGGLVGWWDATNQGQDPTIVELDVCMKAIMKQPRPDGRIGDDLDRILKPAQIQSRVELIEAIERLRRVASRDGGGGAG